MGKLELAEAAEEREESTHTERERERAIQTPHSKSTNYDRPHILYTCIVCRDSERERDRQTETVH